MPGVKRRDDTDNEDVEQDSDSERTSDEASRSSDGSESEESSGLSYYVAMVLNNITAILL